MEKRTCETLILSREDLRESSKTKNILLIKYFDFKTSDEIMIKESIILFIDDNSQTKIIKNRLGDNGNGYFIDIINDIKNNCIDNNLGLGEEYFDSIIDLIV